MRQRLAAGDAVNAPASVVRSTLAAVVLAAVFPAIAAADMMDASLTPGAVEDTDATIVCAYGYASTHRHVPYAERDAVYREYKIPRGHAVGEPAARLPDRTSLGASGVVVGEEAESNATP